ncbi:MAG: hypothetical protein U0176_20000 [Bacteroidia bacterium]
MKKRITYSLLVGLLFTASCSRNDTERLQRETETIEGLNSYLLLSFREMGESGMKEIQDQLQGGNRKNQGIQEHMGKLLKHLDSQVAAIERLQGRAMRLEGVDDSINALSRIYQDFNAQFDSVKAGFRDPSVGQDEINPYSAFLKATSGRSEEELQLELALLKAEMIENAFDKMRYLKSRSINWDCGFGRGDTLSAYAIPTAENVDAGETIIIRIGAMQGLRYAKPEFEGNGEITRATDGNNATLKIKTSEAMIPKGKQESFVSYQAIVKVPRADGEVQNLKVEGKVGIRRPCATSN